MPNSRVSSKRARQHDTGCAGLDAPKPCSLASQIVRQLEEDIVLGRRYPRERLVEQDLCDQFSTHRGEVRQALFELETKGIVVRVPNKGAFVRDLSPEEVVQIYEVREELEVMALRILPFPVPPDAVALLWSLQRQHSRAVDSNDLLAVHHTNAQFHRALFSLCGNVCLIDTIDMLAQKVAGIRSYAHAQASALESSRRDHADMLKAVTEQRRADLIKLARRHLKPAVEAYVKAHRQRYGAPVPSKLAARGR